MRSFMNLLQESEDSFVTAYRGIPAGGRPSFDTSFGCFFSSHETIASGYGPNIRTVQIDISHGLEWTVPVAREFQDYIIDCLEEDEMPQGFQAGLDRYNASWDADITMEEAVETLLRESPGRLNHHELDPLIGAQRAFAMARGKDVIMRRHSGADGMENDSIEYIVFNPQRIHQ